MMFCIRNRCFGVKRLDVYDFKRGIELPLSFITVLKIEDREVLFMLLKILMALGYMKQRLYKMQAFLSFKICSCLKGALLMVTYWM